MRGRGAGCAAAAVLLLVPAAGAAGETVRIGVARGLGTVRISGPGLAAHLLGEEARALSIAGERAELRLDGEKLLLDEAPVAGAGVAFSAGGPLRWGERSLPGEVEVRRGPGGLELVDVLPLEDYVAAVAGAEMPPSFPPQALEAQAVAARTFAVLRKLEATGEGRDFDLGASVLDQVYPGNGAPDPRARAAAEATAGEVLVADHRPIEAYFHSACGGRTESGADALGRDLPYLRSVECGHCQASPRYRWTVRLGAAELGRAVGLPGPATDLRVAARTASGRAARVEIAGGGRRIELAGAELRQLLGYQRLPSLAFSARRDGDAFALDGRGSGHGAGLCQWGAAGLAHEGEGYRAILGRYYPGAEIVRMY